MNISPVTNLSPPQQGSGALPSQGDGAPVSSSKELASVSLNPSVKVSLSSTANASAVANATVPPVYTRVSVGASNVNQLSPSRNSVSGEKSTVAAQPAEGDRAANSAADEGDKEDVKERVKTASDSSERSPNQLSEQEEKQVESLKLRDQEVRAHEQAHKSVGGQYAGAISLSYQAGPDGKRYAVGGEVPIDVSPISGDPQATIAKMNTVKAAAAAPAQPSAQDQSVAAAAARILSEAQSELAAQSQAESKLNSEEASEKAEQAEKDKAASSDKRSANDQKAADAAIRFEEVAGLNEADSVQIDALI